MNGSMNLNTNNFVVKMLTEHFVSTILIWKKDLSERCKEVNKV